MQQGLLLTERLAALLRKVISTPAVEWLAEAWGSPCIQVLRSKPTSPGFLRLAFAGKSLGKKKETTKKEMTC